jgi:hypothetical protein
MSVPVRTDIADPLERLAAVRDYTVEAKEAKAGVSARIMTDLSQHIPGATMAAVARHRHQRTVSRCAARTSSSRTCPARRCRFIWRARSSCSSTAWRRSRTIWGCSSRRRATTAGSPSRSSANAIDHARHRLFPRVHRREFRRPDEGHAEAREGAREAESRYGRAEGGSQGRRETEGKSEACSKAGQQAQGETESRGKRQEAALLFVIPDLIRDPFLRWRHGSRIKSGMTILACRDDDIGVSGPREWDSDVKTVAKGNVTSKNR